MNKIIDLTKILLKNSISFSSDKKKNSKKSIVLYLLLAIYLFASFGSLSYGMISGLTEVHQEGIFLSLMFILIIFLIIFTSIFSQINIFYFSKDISYLIPLPLKPKEIFLAKFNVLLIYEYFIEIVFVIPGIIIYGITTGAEVLFYLYSLIVLALIPIVPLIIVSLIIMVIMCFSRLTKYKERFQIFASLLAILIAIGMQYVPRLIGISPNGELDMNQLVLKANSLVDLFSHYFITLGPSSKALVYSSSLTGLLELIKLIAITIIFGVVYLEIGDKIYFKGLVGNMENSTRKHKVKVNSIEEYKQRGKFGAYLDKEIKPLYRNPIFFMQCVLPAFLLPIMFSIIFFAYPDELKNELSGLLTGINELNNRIFFIILAVLQFLASMYFTTITAISREGLSAPYNKTFPMSLYSQSIAKMIPGQVLNLFSVVTVLAILYILARISIVTILLIIVITTLINIIQGYVMLYIDMKKPKLNWDTEYAVVKQNFNFFYEMVLNFTLVGLLITMSFIPNSINTILITIMFAAVLVAIWRLIDNKFRREQDRLFDNVQ
jgi:ABC-2 type transport system permease protein